MRLRFLDVAQRELDDAVAWYNDQEESLGLEFLRRVMGYAERSPSCRDSYNWPTT